jgi:hypothetical protein
MVSPIKRPGNSDCRRPLNKQQASQLRLAYLTEPRSCCHTAGKEEDRDEPCRARAGPRSHGSISLAATPICCSARPQAAPGPMTLGRCMGPDCRHRGQRTAWPQSMASGSGRRRGSDSADLWIYDPATGRWDDARVARPTQREHLSVTVLDGKALRRRWRMERQEQTQASKSMTRPQTPITSSARRAPCCSLR